MLTVVKIKTVNGNKFSAECTEFRNSPMDYFTLRCGIKPFASKVGGSPTISSAITIVIVISVDYWAYLTSTVCVCFYNGTLPTPPPPPPPPPCLHLSLLLWFLRSLEVSQHLLWAREGSPRSPATRLCLPHWHRVLRLAVCVCVCVSWGS